MTQSVCYEYLLPCGYGHLCHGQFATLEALPKHLEVLPKHLEALPKHLEGLPKHLEYLVFTLVAGLLPLTYTTGICTAFLPNREVVFSIL